MAASDDSVRSRVRTAGIHLGWRQASGVALGIVSVLIVTRLIGPTDFGTYAAAVAVTTAITALFQWGIGLYLVRRGPGVDERIERATLGFAFATGGVAVVAGLALAPTIAAATKISHLLPVLFSVVPGVASLLVRLVPLARLERELRFRTIAVIELSAQVALNVVTIGAALNGAGVWAPVAGWWTQELVLLVGTVTASRLTLRPIWDPTTNRDILRFGRNFSISLWSWQARSALVSIVIGRVLGADAVGVVSLSSRVVEGLGFFKTVAWRLSLPALSAIRGRKGALSLRVTEAIGLQIVAVGVPLVAFSWIAPFVVVPLFGARWAPLLTIFPWLAIAWTTHAAASMVTSALYVSEEMAPPIAYHASSLLLLTIGTIAMAPRLGLLGYGLAEVFSLLGIAALAFTRSVSARCDRFAFVAWILVAASMGSWHFLPWSGLALLAAALWSDGYQEIRARLGRPRRRCVYVVGPHADAHGGVSTVISAYRLAGLFGRHGADLQVLSVSSTRDGSRAFKLFYGCVQLAAFCFRPLGGDTLVHVHLGTGVSFYRKSGYIWIAWLRGARVLAHIHPSAFIRFSSDQRPLRHRLVIATFNRTQAAIALTPEVAEFLRNTLGVTNVLELANPVDLASLRIDESLQRDPATVAFIGWFLREKGAFDLLDAVAQLRGSDIHVELIFAGCKKERELIRHITTLGLEDRVQVRGWLRRRDVARLLHQCTVLALPSHSEGTPMVLYEALACGAPIVTCPVGGVPTIVRETRNAIFVPPGDISALARALSNLLSDPTRRAAMSATNREDAQSFDSQAIATRLLVYYGTLLAVVPGSS